MLSISNPLKGADRAEYYLKLAREDYYTRGGEEPGQWTGSGASWLGLEGTVQPDALRNLLQGYSPDGRERLTQNAGSPQRQTGWDLTFSAPKSASVLWALAPEPVRREIESAHRQAVIEALDQLEREAGITRRGQGGTRKEPAALTFATFLHTTSRAQDPQLHTHALLINLGLRRDGTAGSIQSRDVFRAKMRTGQQYRSTFARLLHERLGLRIVLDRSGFVIEGIPAELCRRFSRRRQAIEKALDRLGRHDAITAKEVTLKTRERKTAIPRAELFALWQERAREFGWGPEQAQAFCQAAQQRRNQNPEQNERAPEETPTGAGERAPAHAQAGPAPDPDPTRRPPGPEPRQPRIGWDEQARAGDARPGPESGERTSTGDRGSSRQRRTRNAREHHRRRSRPRQGAQRSRSSRSPAGGTRWVRLFPHAPDWSPASKIKIPGWLVRQNLPRWRDILWRRRFGLGELRIQKRQVFRHTPAWSQLHRLRLPAIRFVPWYRLDEPPRPLWGKVLWQKRLGPLTLRVQNKRLFPKAPGWSPARRISLPAIRIMLTAPGPAREQMEHGH